MPGTKRKLRRRRGPPLEIRSATRFSGRVAIHDVQGRRLLTLLDGVRPVGSNEVAWDARDRDGNRVSAGVYWCRIETPTRREARKLIVVH
jgi:hypothetical protein